MNLCIDIGNTRIKIGIFKDNDLIASYAIYAQEVNFFETIIANYIPINNLIIAHTGVIPDYLHSVFKNINHKLEFSHNLKFPFSILYKTPETLGHDRIAAVAGAQFLFPQYNVLIIDAGTAITFDILDKDNKYLGGNISPGFNMRFKALHTFTAKLPLLEKSNSFDMIGDSTSKAIINGVINGVINEINGYINDFYNTFKNDNNTVILTGGDADFLANKLKYPIFANENIVLIGLNRILKYNVDK